MGSWEHKGRIFLLGLHFKTDMLTLEIAQSPLFPFFSLTVSFDLVPVMVLQCIWELSIFKAIFVIDSLIKDQSVYFPYNFSLRTQSWVS